MIHELNWAVSHLVNRYSEGLYNMKGLYRQKESGARRYEQSILFIHEYICIFEMYSEDIIECVYVFNDLQISF